MSFFEELKRRNVFKVAFAYFIVSWLLLQVSDTLVPALRLPEWFHSGVAFVLIIGFPMVIIFAWAFEMTPEGLKKEKDVDRSGSITKKTGRKLDFVIIGVLVLGIGYLLVDKFLLEEKGSESFFQQSAGQVQGSESNLENLTLTPSPSPAKDNSIAVLPFANRSRDEDDAFFSDGIHDDLLTQLAKINGLKVISRTSVMKYKNTEKTIPEIAAELGVATILEGGIQRAGKRIRINAQLIDVANDHHIWAETFDREMTVENIFDIQSEITRQIVTAVRGELTAAEQVKLARIPTSNLEAYEAYLHALALLGRADYSQENYIEAEVWIQTAVDLDHTFAQAWARLVGIHGQATWIGYDTSPERFEAAKLALNKARQYGPDLAETLVAQADYQYRIEHDFRAAVVSFKAARKLLPGDADIIFKLASAQRRAGQLEDAVLSFEQSLVLEPFYAQAPTTLAETLLYMNAFERLSRRIDQWLLRFPDARELRIYRSKLYIAEGDLASARALVDSMAPWVGNAYMQMVINLPFLERDYEKAINVWNVPEVLAFAENRGELGSREVFLAWAHHFKGDNEKALTYARLAIEAVNSKPPTGTYTDAFELLNRAQAHTLTGEYEMAVKFANQAQAIIPEDRDLLGGTDVSEWRARVLGLAGKRDEALAEIERLLAHPTGFSHMDLTMDPRWDFFRDDERFNALARPKNLQEKGQ